MEWVLRRKVTARYRERTVYTGHQYSYRRAFWYLIPSRCQDISRCSADHQLISLKVPIATNDFVKNVNQLTSFEMADENSRNLTALRIFLRMRLKQKGRPGDIFSPLNIIKDYDIPPISQHCMSDICWSHGMYRGIPCVYYVLHCIPMQRIRYRANIRTWGAEYETFSVGGKLSHQTSSKKDGGELLLDVSCAKGNSKPQGVPDS